MDIEARCAVVEVLNHALINGAILANKTRSAFWNTSGVGFSQQHKLYEVQSQKMDEIIENISERISMLGGICVGGLTEIFRGAQISDRPQEDADILLLLDDQEVEIRQLRYNIKKCSDLFEDEVSRKILVGVLCEQEKMAWMLRSILEPEYLVFEVDR